MVIGTLRRCSGLSTNGARCDMCLFLMMVGFSMSVISISELTDFVTFHGPDLISCIFLFIPGSRASRFIITFSPGDRVG